MSKSWERSTKTVDHVYFIEYRGLFVRDFDRTSRSERVDGIPLCWERFPFLDLFHSYNWLFCVFWYHSSGSHRYCCRGGRQEKQINRQWPRIWFQCWATIRSIFNILRISTGTGIFRASIRRVLQYRWYVYLSMLSLRNMAFRTAVLNAFIFRITNVYPINSHHSPSFSNRLIHHCYSPL